MTVAELIELLMEHELTAPVGIYLDGSLYGIEADAIEVDRVRTVVGFENAVILGNY